MQTGNKRKLDYDSWKTLAEEIKENYMQSYNHNN